MAFTIASILIHDEVDAFCTSTANMSGSFKAGIVKAIHMLSCVTTLESVNALGGSVKCPPATRFALWARSDLMSKTCDM